MPRRRKRSAWGTLTETSRGVWRIRYWAETPTGYRRCSKTVRGTRKDAEKVRSELMLAHSDDAPCPTVQQLWDSYALPDTMRRVDEGDVAASTLSQYRRWWGKHVAARWGSVPCDKVTPLEVQQWVSQLTLSQAKNAMLVLSKAMDYSVRYGWCKTNPMRERYLMPGRGTVDRRDDGIWSLPELEGLWRRVWGSWMEPAFILSAFGSARVGESLAPLASEVSFRHIGEVPVAVIDIVRQVEHHGKGIDERMKTTDSSRVIAIAGMAATRLADIAASMPSEWPLTNDGMGGIVSQNRYTENWRKLGMEHPYRNLRNSWQTWMRWEMRVEPYFIETMMGHVVKGTTGRFYDRPNADMLAQVMADAYRINPYDKDWKLTS